MSLQVRQARRRVEMEPMLRSLDGLLRPEIVIPILAFLGLCLLSSWALFRALDPRNRRDDG